MQIGEGYILYGAGTGFNGGNVTPWLNFIGAKQRCQNSRHHQGKFHLIETLPSAIDADAL
jgi:hypothetical protein